MGAGWAGMGGDSTKSVNKAKCPGVVGQITLFSVVIGTDKYVQGQSWTGLVAID